MDNRVGWSLSVSKGGPSINPDECRDTRGPPPKKLNLSFYFSCTGIVRRSSSVALDTLLISFEPLEQQGHSGNHTGWSSEFSSENYYRDQRTLRHRNCPYQWLTEKLSNSANDVGPLFLRHFGMHGQTDHLIAQTKTNG